MPDDNDHSHTAPSRPAAQLPACSSGFDDRDELRHHPRYVFAGLQRIAPRYAMELPNDEDFFQVKCYDLSRGGISFLLAGPPSFKRLAVALVCSSKDTIYLGAEVMHFTAVRVLRSGPLKHIGNEASDTDRGWSDEDGGRRMVLVGCRITEHLGTRSTNRLWMERD